MRLPLCVFFLSLVCSCNLDASTDKISGANKSQFFMSHEGSSSILFPVQYLGFGANDPSIGYFTNLKSGFCNTISLAELKYSGQKTRFLIASFSSFLDLEFGKTNLLSSSGDADKENTGENKYNCSKPFLSTYLRESNDSKIISIGENLSLIRGANPVYCDLNASRIVAVRLDPCANASNFNLTKKRRLLPASCRTEVRLVVQVFGPDKEILEQPEDAAFHFTFTLPSLDQVLPYFLRVAEQTERISQTTQSLQKPGELRPHAGLVEEMTRCNSRGLSHRFTDRGIGPVASALRELVKYVADQGTLSEVTWMISSLNRGNWTFGKAKPVYQDGVVFALKSVGPLENFSLREASQGRPATKAPPGTLDITKAFYPKSHLSMSEARRLLETINTIEDPRKISVNAPGQAQESSCVSCHVSGQARARLLGAFPQLRDEFGLHHEADQVWDPFERRSDIDLGNFRYAPDWRFNVARRTLNDTKLSLQLLNAWLDR